MDFNELTDEQKEKVRLCESAEELAAVAAEMGGELSDEELEGISGGSWASNCPKENCSDYDPGVSWPGDCSDMYCHNYAA